MQKFRVKVDGLFYWLFIPIAVILLGVTVTLGILDAVALAIILPIDLFILYFLVSPLFGYCELREEELFIRYGFIITRSIPYGRIRAIEEKRAFYTHSMLSLKCSFSHIDIKYNRFDVTSVGVVDSDIFASLLSQKLGK